ncbi:MAG: hypothetical protein E7329_03590 [Clostridiales bacterium]|nr:hypothetical protein [Clostridiales bacterium]
MKGCFQVRFCLSGLGVEKLLNEARKKGILLHKTVRQADRSLIICCSRRDYRAFRALSEEKGFSLTDAQPVGILGMLSRFKKRRGLWMGMGICIGLLIYSMGFIWQVKIENAGAYTGEIRTYLEEKGIQRGMPRAQIDLAALQESLEWRLPKVKWVQVKYEGVMLVVHVEEGVPPPQVETEGEAGDIIAGEDGLLIRLTAYAGTPQAQAGDFVRAGQVLIKGEERGSNGEWIPVKARGEAIARVWTTVRAQASLLETASIPSGRTYQRPVIQTPLFSFSFHPLPNFLTWDLETEQKSIGGIWLPLVLQREKYLEAALEKQPRSTEEAKEEAQRLAFTSMAKVLQNEEVVDKWVEFSMINGDTIVATATAEIRRDIARQNN